MQYLWKTILSIIVGAAWSIIVIASQAGIVPMGMLYAMFIRSLTSGRMAHSNIGISRIVVMLSCIGAPTAMLLFIGTSKSDREVIWFNLSILFLLMLYAVFCHPREIVSSISLTAIRFILVCVGVNMYFVLRIYLSTKK